MKREDADFNLGYFKEFPAPMYEGLCRLNPADSINSTTPFYGPMLYTIARAIGAHNVLEIGVAQAWSSGFMAWAVKENNSRFAANGRFYAIDIDDKSEIQKEFDAAGLPATFIHHPKGSVDFLENQKGWPPEFFDLIFIDGLHQNEYVEREIELVYPLLKGNGDGYLALHDVYAFLEKLWPKVIVRRGHDKDGESMLAFEHIRFLNNYGFGLLRKMEGYDRKKVFWPDGDQTDLARKGGFIQ
jgi:predicted O-methyltransferase YrrM